MGCGAASKPVKDASPSLKANKSGGGPTGISSAKVNATKNFLHILNDKCPMVRLDHPPEPKLIEVTGETYDYLLQYVYVSQRGYYPNAMNKANQDSYTVCEAMLGDKSTNFFGIFDGHGEYGDYCSHYSADQLPYHLANEIEKNGGIQKALGNDNAMKDTYIRSFLNTNFGLHSSKIDDSLSGTTGITIIQRGDKLFVANVGDSRAIIASEDDAGKLVYSPLSSDQTPYRKDERERLKKAGARIMTMDQIEGNEPIHENFGTNLGEEIDQGGDPPRVWDSTLEKPGCAFSRSIGDSVAKEVGVTAEPEILVWEVSPKDKFAVIASDGVFEFITSQAVVDMIEKYNDKLAAAKHVVSEAYRLWLTYDDRTDDISIIIISFENIRLNPNASPSTTRSTKVHTSVLNSEEMMRESKPVRKVMSKAKRKDIAENWNKDDVVEIDFDKIENTKTEEEIARISSMLANNFMFSNLSPLQKGNIYKVMKLRDVKAGDVIIREGDQGDEMYIIDKGQFNVFKKDPEGKDNQVFTYTDEGAAFGELSLMYGKPRAASVIAKTDGRLWTIGRAAFRAVMMKGGKSDGMFEVFRAVPGLNDLRLADLQRLVVAAKEVNYNKGDLIVNEETAGSFPWAIAVVITGVIRCIPSDESKKRQLRAELSFLSVDEIGSRFKDVTADMKVKLSCIPKKVYDEVVGNNLKKDTSMKDAILKKKTKGKRLQVDKLAIANEERYVLPKDSTISLDCFTLTNPITFVGDFGYMGNFMDAQSKAVLSTKVFAKKRVVDSRLEQKIMNERNYLAALSNTTLTTGSSRNANKAGLPKVLMTLQDDKWLYLLFQERFDCDLSQALSAQAVTDEAKPYYAASVLSAIEKVHDAGLIHRLINSSSFYITQSGQLKLTEFRFAKPMDGSYCFTICGDPLYFAPELVTQQGYDFGVDIWAFGILLYELYEGSSPFGTSETDETTIFRAISAYRPEKLVFNKAPAAAKKLITDVLKFAADDRCGYKDVYSIKSSDFFSDIAWDRIDSMKGHPVDIQPTVELASVLDDQATRKVKTDAFQSF